MSLDHIARNPHGDALFDVLGPLAHRLSSDHYDVHTRQDRFECLMRGKMNNASLSTYSILKPSIFEGFAGTVVASACFEDTMFHRLYTGMGVRLEPVSERLRESLRYDRHDNGHLITVYYATEEDWSKSYRDKQVEDESGIPAKVLDKVRRVVISVMDGEAVAWMGNKDIVDSFFAHVKGERLPNTPHGLNSFQHIHHVVVISALNPPPDHFRFMEGRCVSGAEMKTAHYRTAVYQAVMRCSIRNPADATPKRVVVMDRATAEWLADLFPGAAVEPLPGMGALPAKGKPGRPRKHRDPAEKTSAYRERQRREYLVQLDLINETSFEVGMYPWFNEEVRSQMSELRCDENTYKEGENVTRKSSTSGTAYESIYSNVPIDHIPLLDEDEEFIAFLLDMHGRVLDNKEDSGLISPAHFDPAKVADKKRGLDNITHLRGIWLDNDGGDLGYAEFARLFPYLRVVVWNTYSHTPEKPRWRAFILNTCAMSMEVHRLIIRQIAKVLNREGYWGEKQLEKRPNVKSPRCHGFDEGKFNAASLFYFPCQAKDPAHSFFKDYGADDPKRGPLDLHQWIENCILDIRPEPEPEAPQSVTPQPSMALAPICANLDEKLHAIRE